MENNFFGKDLISIDFLMKSEINYILDYAKEIKNNPDKFSNFMVGKIMAPLFFENSTRTSISFQMAMLQMGGFVLDFDCNTSSLKKGETLSDTIQMINGYSPDVIIFRHNNDGSAQLSADILSSPLINAGDGQNQHPTQTLLDLFTINEILGKIDGVNIAIVGDLKYGRTVHSLALALAKYDNCIIHFVSPDFLNLPNFFLRLLQDKKIKIFLHTLEELSSILKEVDILYMTRIQRERFSEDIEGEREYKKISLNYKIDLDMLKKSKSSLKVMHPLPKVSEIAKEIDNSPYSYYFKQAENGLYVRKALLLLLTKNEL
jgi:aspartate carbamoyltransferase catalytic subunit